VTTATTGVRQDATAVPPEMRRSVSVRIPVRVDFAGGWSDVPYFSAREGGAVVSAAIDLHVEGRAWSTGRGMRVEYGTTVPSGSGLGASAALDVASLALSNALMGRRISAVQLAEDAYRLEKLLGVEGGKQDQYAAALGGVNHLTFGAEEEPATVEPLTLGQAILRTLQEHVVLCYTGSAHHSGSLHERVWQPFLSGERRIGDALREIRDSVPHARAALIAGDLEALGELLTINSEGARRMIPELVTPAMDALFDAAKDAGAVGGKACGAGGGGCLVILAARGHAADVRDAVQRAGAEILPFAFEPTSWWGDHMPAEDV
jgi:D-glycero-alpha-D-manno-heptose-7-phosphate kinase